MSGGKKCRAWLLKLRCSLRNVEDRMLATGHGRIQNAVVLQRASRTRILRHDSTNTTRFRAIGGFVREDDDVAATAPALQR